MGNSTTSSTKTAEQLITENIDVWTSAIKKRGSQGRGSSKKVELYGIKKLRELILELAVRGLLVPQDTNDEPASVLLDKIAAEKERLVKEKKIKKQKTFPVISKEEKLFDLPVGWVWSRLGIVCDKVTDGSHNPPKNAGFGYPMLSSQNINYDVIDFSSPSRFVTYEEFKREDLRTAIKPLDVLLNIVASIGRSAVVPVGAPEFVLQRSVAVLSSKLDSYYFAKMLVSPLCLNYYNKHAKGTAQKGIYLGKLSLMPLAIPPEAEQTRIVAKVDELMSLCDQLEQQTEESLIAHQTLVETLLNALLNAAQTSSALSSVSGQAATSPVSSKVPETKESDLIAKKGGNEGTANLQSEDGRAESETINRRENSFEAAWNRIAEHFDILFTTEHSIDQLKQTILQLAVMGKLVPQDQNDEPASVLLEKIAAEKEQMIKDKKIKKQKPLPPISDDEKPFELPDGWEWARLGSITSLISGQHLKPAEYFEFKSENAVPYITGPAEFGVLNPIYSKFTNEKRALAKENDILITCKGSGLGKWNIAHETIAISRQLMAIRPIKLDDKYLRLIIDSKYNFFQSKGVGIAIPGISREDITEVLVGLPSERELHRITEKVSRLMVICADLKDRISVSQMNQLHQADAMADSIFGRSTITELEEKKEKIAMKISTELSLGNVEYDKTAILAPLIGDDGADAKVVWNKSKLKLPQFYKQLKLEITSGFVAKPAKAEFEG